MSPRRYHLRHQTEYHYSDDVTSSFGRAHLTPPSQHGQRRVTADLIIEPEPAELHHHTDFFGNTSTFFSVTTSHRDLIVTSDCVVETDRTVVSLAELDALSWNHARDIVAPHAVERADVADFVAWLADEAKSEAAATSNPRPRRAAARAKAR